LTYKIYIIRTRQLVTTIYATHEKLH